MLWCVCLSFAAGCTGRLAFRSHLGVFLVYLLTERYRERQTDRQTRRERERETQRVVGWFAYFVNRDI